MQRTWAASRATGREFARQSRRRRGTIINPRKSPETCFQCHLEVRAGFQLPHHHPVLEGKMSCSDCHKPHKGIATKGAPTNIQQKLRTGGLAF